MSEFASQTSQAAQEEVSEIQATPEQDDMIGAGAAADGRMTAAQRSQLETLADEAGETLPPDLTEGQASTHIDRLRTSLGS